RGEPGRACSRPRGRVFELPGIMETIMRQLVAASRLALEAAATTALLLGSSRFVRGQVRASERGSVSQIVDGTSIEVNYGRPRLRGRIAFGGVVHWGEMWTPGANFATTIRFGKDVKFSGRAVPAGRY